MQKVSKEKAREDALAFLKHNFVAVIATSIKNMPHAATVYYLIDDNFRFYFVTKINTSKYLNISLNNNVAVVVGTGLEHITLQAQGKADILVDDERADVLEKMNDLYAREFIKSLPVKEMEDFKSRTSVVFRVDPTSIFFMNLDSVQFPESVSTEYHQILP